MTQSNKTPKDLRPLIDGDILCYRCGFAADAGAYRRIMRTSGVSKEVAIEMAKEEDYLAEALKNVKTVLESITNRFSDEYKLYLHAEGNYRERLATLQPYKGTRPGTKPKYYDEIKDYLFRVWKAIPIRGMESDDAIGLEQFDNPDKYTVIVSIDKDMDCIPGWHYNWVKGNMYYQTINEANLFFFSQMLSGDRVDNIPGIRGVGAVSIKKLLEKTKRDVSAFRHEVQLLYQKQYGDDWLRAYTEVGNLLWILRRPEQLDKGCPLL